VQADEFDKKSAPLFGSAASFGIARVHRCIMREHAMIDTRSYGSITVDEQSYKLPPRSVRSVIKSVLTPDLTAFTFAGEETVTVQVLEQRRKSA